MKQEIKSMREILDRLEAAHAKQETGVKIEDGFVLNMYGDIKNASKPVDAREACSQGNWFPTREAAEKESKRRAVIQKMRGFTNGFVPDWGDEKQCKYSLNYSHRDGRFENENWKTYRGNALFEVYFRTHKDAQACIDAMGDEIRSVL